MQERLRQEGKAAALVAMRQAELTALALGGKKLPEVYEAFPFWTEEEVRERKVEKYRRVMERYAAASAAGGRNPARKEKRRE